MEKIVNGKRVPLSALEIKTIEKERSEEVRKKESADYRSLRAQNYPPIGDQLDAILKQLNYMQMNGDVDLITSMDKIIGEWLHVKKEYPKE